MSGRRSGWLPSTPRCARAAETMARELDAAQAGAALEFDPAWVAALQAQWRELIEVAVWGDFNMTRLGAAPRLRRRLLELGERLKSLTASRAWIPHPRERLKSALAAALGVREALAALDGILAELAPGTDAARLGTALQTLRSLIGRELPARENAWARLLDAQAGD